MAVLDAALAEMPSSVEVQTPQPSGSELTPYTLRSCVPESPLPDAIQPRCLHFSLGEGGLVFVSWV